MADEKDLDVSELESEFLHARPDKRDILLKIAVNKDVSLRGGDQIVGEAFATNIVEIPRNFERRKWFGPISIGLGIQGPGRADDCNKCPKEHDPQTEPVLLHVVQLQFVCAAKRHCSPGAHAPLRLAANSMCALRRNGLEAGCD